MFAIKVNDKHWLPDYHSSSKSDNFDYVLTFTTEKKALKEKESILKMPSYAGLKLEVIEVEEELDIDIENGICKQSIREL